MSSKVALYSAVGSALTHFEVDVQRATLTQRATIQTPANVQYAWPHPSRRYLYVATSNRGPGLKSDYNHLSAFKIDPHTGALSPHGESQTHYARAVHICVEPQGQYVLSGHNLPRPGLTINPIAADGRLAPAVAQRHADLDFGIYPHQVMSTPSGRAAIIIDRGNDAAKGKPEDPGALRFYHLDRGQLSPFCAVAPNWGYGFGPRHLDFHPTQPWLYVSLERQNQLYMYHMVGDVCATDASFVRSTLANPHQVMPRQLAGTIHVHPNGRFVYVMNRADSSVDFHGQHVFNGGENSIAVFALDPHTGEPTLIQHAQIQNIHVRTFSIDPSGQLLITGSIEPHKMRNPDGGSTAIIDMPAALSLMRIGADGRLTFLSRVDIQTGDQQQYWTGMVGLPQTA
jgi:6-phosphogluconolactonase (cycloisomerase 2 family)